MTTIITQNRTNILNSEAIECISAEPMNVGSGIEIWAHTLNGADILIGTYADKKNAEKVMTYISFCLTDDGKAVIIPSEEVVANDKKITADFIGKIMDEIIKKGPAESGVKVQKVKIDPKLKEILENLKGGEDK